MKKLIFTYLIFTVLGLSSVYARTSAPDYGSLPADSVMTLDEVNVIAMKQSGILRDEAVSATVIGSSELESVNAVAIKGLSDMVPNFFVPDYGSRITSTMYVRGIGARMDQPAVGLNVDNVPFLNKNTYDFDLADITSVEMLRGPQSTLFGRNTIGGLVNITTLSPLRFQGWRISALGGNGNDWRLSAGYYHKFDKRTATSLTVNFSYLGGFFRNLYDGKLLDKELSGALRWKLDREVSDRVTINNVASASILRQGGYPYEYVGTGEINYNDTCFYRRFTVNDGLTLKWKHDRFDMMSVTSLQYLDDNMTLDQDFLPLPYFTLTQKQKEFSVTEDVVFKGAEAGGKYRWLAGAFGFYKHLSMSAPVLFKDYGIRELIEDHRNDANPTYPIFWDTRDFGLYSDFTIPTVGAALYHESVFETGPWKFTAGIRLDWEQAKLDFRSRCNTGYDVMKVNADGGLDLYRHIEIDIDDTGKLTRSYFTWMPKISAMYSFGAKRMHNVYAAVSKGYKSGGFNTQMFSDVLKQRLMGLMGIGEDYAVDQVVGYKPEYSWNYEVGAHLSFPEAHLSAELSAFYIDCRDQQLTMFPSGSTTGRIMTNAGRTRSFGGEVSAQWNPVSSLFVRAAYGYTNAKFLKFFDGIDNFRGNYLPYAPQNTLFAQAEYTFNLGDFYFHSLNIEVNTSGAGKIYWNEGNTLSQNFYSLLGASLTLASKNIELQIWGKNLLNQDYYTFYFMSMGNEFLQRGRPLQAGATIRLNF